MRSNKGGNKIRHVFLSIFHLSACSLVCHILPPVVLFFSEEEVADHKEGDTDDDAINDSATSDGDKDMPPKAKPAAAKSMTASTKPAATTAATTVTAATKVTVMPPPATKKLVLYFLDACNVAIITYYKDAAVDYAEVEVHINGVVPEGSCKFTVAVDGMSISWQRTTDKICFASEHLKAVMKDNYYSTSHNHVIKYKNIAQKMIGDEVTPDTVGPFWGASQ